MAYNETYTSSDMSKIVIDILATIGVALAGFATIVGLVILFRWLSGKKVLPR